MIENELPNGWLLTTLNKIGQIISGGTPSTSIQDYWGGDVSWISPVDLSKYESKYISKGAKSITQLGLLKSSAKLMPAGSVLFSSRAPIGYVVIAAQELCTNQGFKSIIPNDSIYNEYLYYFLKASKRQADDLASGTTFKEISLTNFSIIEIPLPPLAEQQRIVEKIEELFSELDKGIETLKTAQQQLKIYRQAVLKYAFEGKLTNPDVKEGELPEGWVIFQLKDLCEITSSKRIFKDEYVSQGVPFYRTKEVKELSEGKSPSIELFIETSKYEEIRSRFQVPTKGDVLLSAVGTIGVSYVIRDSRPFYFKDGNLMWFRNFKNLNSFYLSYALTHFIKNVKDANVSGSAYNALTIETMKSFELPIPELEIQHAIVQEIESRFSVCDKIEVSIIQGLQQAEALRQSILKKAFEGKLVPQDPNDEPGRVLLERIKEERAAAQPEKKTKTKKVKV